MLKEEYDPHRFDAPEGIKVPQLSVKQIAQINEVASRQEFFLRSDSVPTILRVSPDLFVGLFYEQYPSDGSVTPYASLMVGRESTFFSLADLRIRLMPSPNDAFWGVEEISGVVLERCISSARFLNPIIGSSYSLHVEKTGWDSNGSDISPEPPFNFEGLRVPLKC